MKQSRRTGKTEKKDNQELHNCIYPATHSTERATIKHGNSQQGISTSDVRVSLWKHPCMHCPSHKWITMTDIQSTTKLALLCKQNSFYSTYICMLTPTCKLSMQNHHHNIHTGLYTCTDQSAALAWTTRKVLGAMIVAWCQNCDKSATNGSADVDCPVLRHCHCHCVAGRLPHRGLLPDCFLWRGSLWLHLQS